MTLAVQMRQQTSMARWSEIIAEQRNSGFTIQDFCEQRIYLFMPIIIG